MFTSGQYLFNQADWFSVEQSQEERMLEEIGGLTSDRILGTSIEDLCVYFYDTYRLDVPLLLKEEIVADQRERQIDVSDERDRYWSTPGPHYVNGTEISASIPFLGVAELFTIQPRSFTLSPPRGEIQGNSLILRVSGTALNAGAVRAELDGMIAEIEGYLNTLRRDAEAFNERIKARARQQIEGRRGKLLRDQNLVAELGFPLKERAQRTYVPPEIRRRIKPSLPPAASEAFRPEPALTSDDYEHILTVVESMAQVMERSPSAFYALDEESLRSQVLVQLNGHYQGQATGETFNYSGKTDILIRVEDRNIFVAECKYWDGKKTVSDALNQLLSYSSWRDTKVALIIFNRRKNFSSVLQEITPTIEKHPNHKRTIPVPGETRFRFILAHRDDSAREMIVTVLVFDVPSESSPISNA